MIDPENIHLVTPGYTADHWDYAKRSADIELALAWAKDRIEEWDQASDPHGWWHERPHLIALYNAVRKHMDKHRTITITITEAQFKALAGAVAYSENQYESEEDPPAYWVTGMNELNLLFTAIKSAWYAGW